MYASIWIISSNNGTLKRICLNIFRNLPNYWSNFSLSYLYGNRRVIWHLFYLESFSSYSLVAHITFVTSLLLPVFAFLFIGSSNFYDAISLSRCADIGSWYVFPLLVIIVLHYSLKFISWLSNFACWFNWTLNILFYMASYQILLIRCLMASIWAYVFCFWASMKLSIINSKLDFCSFGVGYRSCYNNILFGILATMVWNSCLY